MALKTTDTCYMCDKIATTEEHAPPKCIFPEMKDTNGVDYRRNLIKVPSCDEHNTQKSKEDEYLLYILPASIGSNTTGLNQFLTKVQRAISRKPALSDQLSKNTAVVTVHDTEKDIWFKTIAFEFDIGRIQDALEKTARAIYFYHTKRKCLGKVSLVGNFSLNLQNVALNFRTEELFTISEMLLSSQSRYGDNPDVFTYRIAEHENNVVIELQFYGLNKALAFLQI